MYAKFRENWTKTVGGLAIWKKNKVWQHPDIQSPDRRQPITYRLLVPPAAGSYGATKNLAIANRSRISCAHNTSEASMITPWRWNVARVTYGHWKRNHWTDHTRFTISRSIWHYRHLEVWIRGHSKSLMYGFLFAFHSNYGRIFSHFGDIQSQ